MTYRESYQSTDLFRESKSVSPGRLHKTRQSFGPTLCLISNKNPPVSNPQIDPSQDKIKILMLSMEIQRLHTSINNLIAQKSIRYSQANTSENQYLHRQISNLRAQLETVQKSKYHQIQKLSQTIYANNTKVVQYQTQIKIFNRRHEESNETMKELRMKIRELEEEVSRAKAEASRANFNALLSSQTDLQRSTIRQRNNQIDRWKEKLSQSQRNYDQQKIIVLSQRQMIDKLKNSELQIRHKYEYQLSNLKTQNDHLKQKIFKLQNQISHETSSLEQHFRKEIRNRQLQYDKILSLKQSLQLKLIHEQKQRRDLEKKYSEGQRESETQMRQKIQNLQQTIDSLEKKLEEERKKNERSTQTINKLTNHNNYLESELKNIKNKLNIEISTRDEEIEKKEQYIRKIKKQKRQINNGSENRINKSLSESNLHLRSSNLRNSEHSLKGIIAQVVELQNSNTRMARIIQNRNSVVGSRMVSYSTYGL